MNSPTIKRRDGELWVEGTDGLRPATPLECAQYHQIRAIRDEMRSRISELTAEKYREAWLEGHCYGKRLTARRLKNHLEIPVHNLEKFADQAFANGGIGTDQRDEIKFACRKARDILEEDTHD